MISQTTEPKFVRPWRGDKWGDTEGGADEDVSWGLGGEKNPPCFKDPTEKEEKPGVHDAFLSRSTKKPGSESREGSTFRTPDRGDPAGKEVSNGEENRQKRERCWRTGK